MPKKRSPEYQCYLDLEAGRKKDGDSRDVEISATKKEIGWRKKFQFTRAMNHARAGEATRAELIYLARHGISYPKTPKEYLKKPTLGKKFPWEPN